MSQIDYAQDVCDGTVSAIRTALTQVKSNLKHDLRTALETVYSEQRKKPALRVDLDSEDQFKQGLRKHFSNIEVFGEETLTPSDRFEDHDGTVCIVDPIDGTDLLERNLSNWCIAAVVIRPKNPQGQRILAASVGFPSGRIYYAREGLNGVEYKTPKPDGLGFTTMKTTGPSSITKLVNASICFYGQKIALLQSVMQLPLIQHLVEQSDKKSKKTAKNLRIYTLAGIPMMVRLIDHEIKSAANIDVVFDSEGQKPYDAVPGLYLALKGGAKAINLDTSKQITPLDLERAILYPAGGKIRYVVAATMRLCDEIAPLLKQKARPALVGS
ncbi:MAG: Inositol monophosphatase family [Blastocatellia bacterium]|jgi:fructose-1,6-bisphosphatase/inositol monophosphatase family enzyme|nr:Inositol monophosphatase family [Blastocatellia bacterium]